MAKVIGVSVSKIGTRASFQGASASWRHMCRGAGPRTRRKGATECTSDRSPAPSPGRDPPERIVAPASSPPPAGDGKTGQGRAQRRPTVPGASGAPRSSAPREPGREVRGQVVRPRQGSPLSPRAADRRRPPPSARRRRDAERLAAVAPGPSDVLSADPAHNPAVAADRSRFAESRARLPGADDPLAGAAQNEARRRRLLSGGGSTHRRSPSPSCEAAGDAWLILPAR